MNNRLWYLMILLSIITIVISSLVFEVRELRDQNASMEKRINEQQKTIAAYRQWYAETEKHP